AVLTVPAEAAQPADLALPSDPGLAACA
ncbi:MAG: hypothetical protein JWQ83_1995, partial [Lacunisphaera sp.]|nr:hypothetical protein [Lacunisphaera sp.]